MKRWLIFIDGVASYAVFFATFLRDLIAEHPEYAQYRKSVPMLVPFTKARRRQSDSIAAT